MKGIQAVNPRIVTIFGSSTARDRSTEYKHAYELGRLLALDGYLILNGGYSGTMEASARGAKDAGGKSIGVIAEHFNKLANIYTSEVIEVKTHAERLGKLIELGDAYVVLKGGTGTLLELATTVEYMNKSVMRAKPIITVGDFWPRILEPLLDEIKIENLSDVVRQVKSVQECVALLRKLVPVFATKR